jgi:hypothetical protein
MGASPPRYISAIDSISTREAVPAHPAREDAHALMHQRREKSLKERVARLTQAWGAASSRESRMS